MRHVLSRLGSAATTAVLLPLLALTPAIRNQAAAPTPYPGGRWSPPAPTFEAVVESERRFPMSDGVVLVGDVVYPADPATGLRAPGPFPVLLTQNPYRGAGVGVNSVDPAAVPGEYFVQRGYIFMTVDVRGTSRSGGRNDVFGPRSSQDGAELVKWASGLPGSNGVVGLQGCSYLGINQLDTAVLLGPNSPVKAMIPACASGDFYRDQYFDNGIPAPLVPFALIGIALVGVRPDPVDMVTLANLGGVDQFTDIMRGGTLGYYNQYWEERDRTARAQQIAATGIPILLWAGWQEGPGNSTFELYSVLQNSAVGREPFAPMRTGDKVTGKYQVVVGDWAHGGGLDESLELQWFETWLKGVDTGLPTRTDTPLHVQDLGTGRWLKGSTWPMTGDYTELRLGAGTLTTKAAPTGTDQLVWGPSEPGSGTAVTYLGPVLDQGATLGGPGAVDVWASSSNTNLQLVAQVLVVAPDGTETPVMHGSILGSRAQLDPAKSWVDDNGAPTRPYMTLRRDDYAVPNSVQRLQIPLQPTVRTIEPGRRLALRISTQSPQNQCALAAGIGPAPWACVHTRPMLETLPGGIYQVLRGGDHPSSLNLPLLPYKALAESRDGVIAGDGSTLPGDW